MAVKKNALFFNDAADMTVVSGWMEWGYPDIGAYIADCLSTGHNMIALDYSICGSDGESQAVYHRP